MSHAFGADIYGYACAYSVVPIRNKPRLWRWCQGRVHVTELNSMDVEDVENAKTLSNCVDREG